MAKDLVARAKENIDGEEGYRHVADTTKVLGKFLPGITLILAFLAMAYPDQRKILSFSAGIVGTVGWYCLDGLNMLRRSLQNG